MSNSSSTAYLAALQHQLSYVLVLIIHATGSGNHKNRGDGLRPSPLRVFDSRLPVSLMCPPHSSPKSGALETPSIRSCVVSLAHPAPPPVPVWALPVLLPALLPALPLALPSAPLAVRRADLRSRRGLTQQQARIHRRAPATQPELAPA